MRTVPHVATVALALWWAPTFVVAIVRAAPYVDAGLTECGASAASSIAATSTKPSASSPP